MHASKKTLLVIGPKPPALTGGIASFIGFQLSSPQLKEKYRMICLDTSLSPGLRGNKLMRLIGSVMLSIRLTVMLRAHRPELVHIHTSSFMSFWEKGLLIMICRLFDRKVVLHMHGAMFDSFYRNSRLKFLIRFVLDRADAMVVLTSYWKEFCSSLTETRLEIIPNCPQKEFFHVAGDAGAGGSVVFTGTVGPRKGVDVLLEAVKILRSRGVNNPVVLAGDGESEGLLDIYLRQVEDQGLGEVGLRGNVDPEGLKVLLAEAALFCLPSRAEGLPIAILEAMAAGLPIVATPVGGIPDAIEEGVNGFLVPVGESGQLAEKLELLLSDPVRRGEIGEANRRKARTYYHPESTSHALINLYQSLDC